MDYEYLAKDYMDEEVPRHVKKKPAKKKLGKSNHKHVYKDCLIKQNNNYNTYLVGKYCTICGKLSDTQFFDSEAVGGSSYRRLLNNEELLKKYSDYEVVEIDDICNTKKIKL